MKGKYESINVTARGRKASEGEKRAWALKHRRSRYRRPIKHSTVITRETRPPTYRQPSRTAINKETETSSRRIFPSFARSMPACAAADFVGRALRRTWIFLRAVAGAARAGWAQKKEKKKKTKTRKKYTRREFLSLGNLLFVRGSWLVRPQFARTTRRTYVCAHMCLYKYV